MDSSINSINKMMAGKMEDVICELGSQARLGYEYEPVWRVGVYMPLTLDGGPIWRGGPYPEAFYMAQRWLLLKRQEIQKAIIHEWDYGSKQSMYSSEHQAELIKDLAAVISPLCHEPKLVDPILVAVLLFKLGLGDFCRDYGKPVDEVRWDLERALGLDPVAADEVVRRGNKLLWSGNWKAAIPLYEEALSQFALHTAALNDLAYIYVCYMPGDSRGPAMVQWLASYTFPGEPSECAILDTLAWFEYRQGGDLKVAEKRLRRAIDLFINAKQKPWKIIDPAKPGSRGYLTLIYHLVAVLVDTGQEAQAEELYGTLGEVQPLNALDEQSFLAMRKLVNKRRIIKRLCFWRRSG